jgi:hypothetical protein
VYKIEI